MAAVRRSSGSPCLQPTQDHLPKLDIVLPSTTNDAMANVPGLATVAPLIPRTTLIIGDSTVRLLRFVNAVTHCFPGATVPDIIGKLPGLLISLPATVHKIIVHIGTNDISRQQSEVLKADFIRLIDMLNSCGRSIFLSGPFPTLDCGVGRFSRTLSLHTWLQSTCTSHKIDYVDNFNLFWNRPSFFLRDGFHPNLLGSRVLADNIRHAVLSSTRVS